jgi:hypothetical protein
MNALYFDILLGSLFKASSYADGFLMPKSLIFFISKFSLFLSLSEKLDLLSDISGAISEYFFFLI